MPRDAHPRSIKLSEYQSPAYQIEEVDLRFEIADGSTEVTSRLQVRRSSGTPAGTALRLDGQDLTLVSVAVDGAPLGSNQYRVDDDSLTLYDLPESAEIRIVTRICPEENTALEGLYKSGGMYCTQCEAEGFRRITYYQDRPDVLARFTTTIVADAERYPVLLSNGNPIGDRRLEGGRREVTWEDPFPKPSYLFAMVAGDLALLEDRYVTASGRTVALRIYSEPHNIGQCGYAMESLKRAMRWDEQAFGREYDLDIYMIVAVDDFNMGAMENKGLNIFNTSATLASPDTATDDGYERVEAIVAHEYFHNWSGNRVTCRDWFQLSLKEGFTVFRDAEFTSDVRSRTVKRIDDVMLLRSVQFAEDAGPLAHPIRPASYIEISNFYTPTVYEKGAEVVRMLHTLLGPDRFRRGCDLYFERHDGQAVTTEDFVAALADASGLDLGQFQRWYDQAGTPVLTVNESFEGGCFTLRIAQSCPATPGQPAKAAFHIPVLLGMLDATGRELAGLQVEASDPLETREPAAGGMLLHLRSAEATVTVRGLVEKPIVSLLRGFSAPVRVHHARPPAELALLAVNDSDGFVRWDSLQTLVVGEIARLQERAAAGAAGTVEPSLLALFGDILGHALRAPDEAEPKLMLAAMLTLPDENYLFEQFDRVDVGRLCDARDALHLAISQRFRDDWRALYEANRSRGPFSPDPLPAARRALKHVALGFLAPALPGSEAETLLGDHYLRADNLTERRAALWETMRHPGLAAEFRQRLFDDFYGRWQREALVVNLWFSLQAGSPSTTAEAARALAGHAAFDARNPNKLRSLYGAFALRNHRNFHASDGSGYRFLAEAVADVDGRNPSMAASLAKPLTRWRRLDPERARSMRAVLEHLATGEGLSPDLYEVVTKSLAEGAEGQS
jgi:aminopeptidase N